MNILARTIHTQIEIAAPAQAIWDVLTDFAHWPEWNLAIPRARTTMRAGAPIDIVVSIRGAKLPLTASLHRVMPPWELRWRGGIRGVFTADHGFRIEPIGQDLCRFVHDENFDGFVSPLLGRILVIALQSSYERMNEALKARVERGMARP